MRANYGSYVVISFSRERTEIFNTIYITELARDHNELISKRATNGVIMFSLMVTLVEVVSDNDTKESPRWLACDNPTL